MKRRVLFDASQINRMLTRMAHEINERTDIHQVVLVGIKTRGANLADRLQEKLATITQVQVAVEHIDMSPSVSSSTNGAALVSGDRSALEASR